MSSDLDAYVEPDQDLSHPIPRLDTLDVLLESDKAARVGIVIASPLQDDTRSRVRFERKLELCLQYFWRPTFSERYGAPTPASAQLYISIHAGSHPAMMDLVNAQTERISQHGVRPVIKLIGSN